MGGTTLHLSGVVYIPCVREGRGRSRFPAQGSDDHMT